MLITKIMYILMIIISTSVSNVAASQVKCASLFHFDTPTKNQLKYQFAEYLKKWGFTNQSHMFRINQDGVVLERNNTRVWETNKNLIVYMIGRNKSGDYVDFEVVSDFGRPTSILRREPIDTFINRVRTHFLDSLKPEYSSFNKHLFTVVVPMQNTKYRLGQIIGLSFNKKINQHEANVQFDNGEVAKYNIDNLIRWNLQIDPYKLQSYNQFLQSGGSGYLVYFPRSEVYGIIENQNTYFVIQKLPTRSKVSSFKFLLDPRVISELEGLLHLGLPILFTASGAVASVASHDNPTMKFLRQITGENKKSAGLFLSEKITFDILMHEKIHLLDQNSGFASDLAMQLEGSQRSLNLTDLGRLRVFQFIIEQRAHAHQFNAILKDTSENSSQRAQKVFKEFNTRYQLPLFEFLNSLESSERNEVINFLRKWAMPIQNLPPIFNINY